MKPILKWPGGKRKLLPYIEKIINSDSLGSGRLYEPFIGGGALSFDLGHKRTVINDLNPELINLYRVVKAYPEELIKELKQHQYMACCEDTAEDYYYEVRAWDRDPEFELKYDPVARAARTVYLNKTCFNGLYRVNSKGYFNSPLGRTSSGKCPDIVQEQEIRELSKFLQTVDIRSGDYEKALEDTLPGDWIYFDPPYDPGEEISTSGFVGYQKEGWTRHDTLRLKSVCDKLYRLGCKIVISNNDTPFIREVFSDFEIFSIEASRSINRDGSNRKGKEVLIFSPNINAKLFDDLQNDLFSNI